MPSSHLAYQSLGQIELGTLGSSPAYRPRLLGTIRVGAETPDPRPSHPTSPWGDLERASLPVSPTAIRLGASLALPGSRKPPMKDIGEIPCDNQA